MSDNGNPTRKDAGHTVLHLDVWFDEQTKGVGANWENTDFPNFDFILMVLEGAKNAVEATKRAALVGQLQQRAADANLAERLKRSVRL